VTFAITLSLIQKEGQSAKQSQPERTDACFP